MLTIGKNDVSNQLEDDSLFKSSKTVGSIASIKATMDSNTKEVLDIIINKLSKRVLEKAQIDAMDYEQLIRGNSEVIMTYQKGSLWCQQNVDSMSSDCLNLIFNEVRINN